jgi:hypothetical protein
VRRADDLVHPLTRTWNCLNRAPATLSDSSLAAAPALGAVEGRAGATLQSCAIAADARQKIRISPFLVTFAQVEGVPVPKRREKRRTQLKLAQPGGG